MSIPCHHVYIFARKLDDGFSAPVKVGITGNLKRRLSKLRTGCPFPIDLYFRVDVPDRDIAREIEDGFHQCQAEHQTWGEWFDLAPGKAAFLLRLAYACGLYYRGERDDANDLAEELSAFGWDETPFGTSP